MSPHRKYYSSSRLVRHSKTIPTQILINLVRDRSCLWDRTHAGYWDPEVKHAAWHQIFREFEPEYDTLRPSKKKFMRRLIMGKWNNVRNSYVKSRKQGKNYLHSEGLQFLDALYCTDRAQRVSDGYECINLVSDAEGPDDVTQTLVRDVQNKNLDVKDPKLDDARECNVVAVLTSLLHKEDDEDRAFFKSITPAVKTLSESSKLEFRVRVLELISSLKAKGQMATLKVERVSSESE